AGRQALRLEALPGQERTSDHQGHSTPDEDLSELGSGSRGGFGHGLRVYMDAVFLTCARRFRVGSAQGGNLSATDLHSLSRQGLGTCASHDRHSPNALFTLTDLMTQPSRLTFALLPFLIASAWTPAVQAAPTSASPSQAVVQRVALQKVTSVEGIT